MAKRTKVKRRCRKCGCTDNRACRGGCSWVERDLCSRCAPVAAAEKKRRSAEYDELNQRELAKLQVLNHALQRHFDFGGGQ